MQGEEGAKGATEEVKVRTVFLALWFVLSLVSAFGAFHGGDTSILCGWAFVVLTFPFWLAWQTYAYNIVSHFVSKSVVDVIGAGLSLFAALIVWWYAVSLLLQRARAYSKAHTKG